MPDQGATPAPPPKEPVSTTATTVYKERGGVLPPFSIRPARLGNERDTGIFDSKGQLIAEIYETVARQRVPDAGPLTDRVLQQQGLPVRIDSVATARLWVRILNAHWNDEEEA
jgi:hypothetical protein